MNAGTQASPIPMIDDDDIKWVKELLGLSDLDPPRIQFLKSNTTVDISACPGSGKTTLIIAKLAMLARKWPYVNRGICVLSHTNVARIEIIKRLGDTLIGNKLLRFPHYIDTLHGFSNKFLAMPWLHSNRQFSSLTIDDELTSKFRYRSLGASKAKTLQDFLERKNTSISNLRICCTGLSFDLNGKPFPSGSGTKTYDFAKKAIQASSSAGYYCFDEMFVFAKATINEYPQCKHWLQHRFPVVFIDEMQDTARVVGGIIEEVFPLDNSNIVVQRVGDPNQAIFDDGEDSEISESSFPNQDSSKLVSITNSHRFGSQIANVADRFAVMPIGTSGLRGLKSTNTNTRGQEICPTLILFQSAYPTKAIDKYGKILLDSFSDDVLNSGKIAAVGAIHKVDHDLKPDDPKYPRSVSHYWEAYSPKLNSRDSQPATLVDYVRVARSLVTQNQDLAEGIAKLVAAIYRLARIIGENSGVQLPSRNYKTLLQRLKPNLSTHKLCQTLFAQTLLAQSELRKDDWLTFKANAIELAQSLLDGDSDTGRAEEFLKWSDFDQPTLPSGQNTSLALSPNVYRYSENGRYVDIQFGSIHSVKGETHFSTCLLSTYWYEHSTKHIISRLLDTKAFAASGKRDQRRLLQSFVALTRPSQLACIALPSDRIGSAVEIEDLTKQLSKLGWCIEIATP